MDKAVDEVGINPDFISLVKVGRQYLTELQQLCQQQTDVSGAGFVQLEQSFDLDFDHFLEKFEYLRSDISNSENQVYKHYFREMLLPFILLSPIANRIYHKPLGYPGDYEMINMMLGETQIDYGSNLFSVLLDNPFKRSEIVAAHQNRLDFLVEQLLAEIRTVNAKGKVLTSLSIGVGAGIELKKLCEKIEPKYSVFIQVVDFHQEALEKLREKLVPIIENRRLNVVIEYTHLSLETLLTGVKEIAKAYHFIYCAGLFDYLSDQLSKKIIQFAYDKVAAEGIVIISNLHPTMPNKGYLDYALDWQFRYRDRQAMRQLLSTDSKFNRLEIDTDATGLNVILHGRK